MQTRKLKAPLPEGRTLASVTRHFEIESALATRLTAATRDERKQLYRTMYAELFAAVPDHPRLTRRASESDTARDNCTKHALVERFVGPSTRLAEIGAGDGRFAVELARRVAHVTALDICDQLGSAARPANFELVIYDGFEVPLAPASLDVAFSDQLLEHLHPDDVALHFASVRRALRPGGTYVLRTPHRHGGPHDVSRYFQDEPAGFHLKEWTFAELACQAASADFARIETFLLRDDHLRPIERAEIELIERCAAVLPRGLRRKVARRWYRHIVLACRVA
ncbi:MAG: class I SAM-dependent methyltransferase [Planctomycetes bacterium]|nr:class I SAM-dependent methyltransferase [Planctomycetota bacterium]